MLQSGYCVSAHPPPEIAEATAAPENAIAERIGSASRLRREVHPPSRLYEACGSDKRRFQLYLIESHQ
jgi:hypothetical protein